MPKWSSFIRNLGTAGPDTLQGIYDLGFALRSEIPALFAKYVRVDAAQSFTNPEKLQGRTNLGLGNVDNTSDANKPISTATQTAIDLKAPLASPALTGNPTAPTQAAGNSSPRIATTAFVASKADLTNPNTFAGSQTWAKGANIASAATLVLGTDGNLFHVIGSVTITAISGAASPVTLVFDASPVLTHNATTLILPGAANLTPNAGDTAVFAVDGAGNWRCTSFTRAASGYGAVLPVVRVDNYTSAASIPGVIPADDTIPLVSEGTQIHTLTFTPKAGVNLVRISWSGEVTGNGSENVTAAAFVGSVCAQARIITITASNIKFMHTLDTTFAVTPGVSITVTIRIGGTGTNLISLNGAYASRLLGGASAATLVIQDIGVA